MKNKVTKKSFENSLTLTIKHEKDMKDTILMSSTIDFIPFQAKAPSLPVFKGYCI